MKRIAATVLTLSTVLAAATPVVGWCRSHGAGPQQPQQAPVVAVTRAGMSLDDAVQMVQARFNARVVRAETRNEEGRRVHHLRLMNAEGKVWTVRVDADSGAVQ